jgi:HPr kinase/phosphorylase
MLLLHHNITVHEIFEVHKDKLNLSWFFGQEYAQRNLLYMPEALSTMVGFLNFVHPPQITIFAAQEFHYLANLDINAYQEAVKQFFAAQPALIILCEDQHATDEIMAGAQQQEVPILRTHLPASRILNRLNHHLTTNFAPNITVHGVFMDVFDLGVLLTGDSGVGKSELALELINRGHRLVADDSPFFSKEAPDLLMGRCPELLQDFLEVRGLGIINVRAMFGNTAVKKCKRLDLIVHVIDMSDPVVAKIDRLAGMHRKREFLDVAIPEVTLPAGPGRSLSVLVEAAVHNQVLRKGGYDACKVFTRKQGEMISKEKELEPSLPS